MRKPENVRPRGRNSWDFWVDLARGSDGKRNRKHVTVKGTWQKAESERARMLAEVGAGSYIDPTNLTVSAYLDHWMSLTSNARSGKTNDEYRRIIDNHLRPCLGHVHVAKLKPLHIQAYYTDRLENGRCKLPERPPAKRPRLDAEGKPIPRVVPPKGLSAQTVRHHHTLLHKALEDAVRWQLIAANAADAADPPKIVREEMKILTTEQVRMLLEAAASSSYRIALALAVATGMRRGELLALRWQDVDLETGMVTVSRSVQQTRGRVLAIKGTKTGKTRLLPISTRTVQELIRHRGIQAQHRLWIGETWEDNDLVVARPNGAIVVPDVLSNRFHEIANKAGLLPIRLHDLRHTHVAILISQGEHAKVISERLGHSSIAITMDRYGHLFPALSRSAADRFDEALGW